MSSTLSSFSRLFLYALAISGVIATLASCGGDVETVAGSGGRSGSGGGTSAGSGGSTGSGGSAPGSGGSIGSGGSASGSGGSGHGGSGGIGNGGRGSGGSGTGGAVGGGGGGDVVGGSGGGPSTGGAAGTGMGGGGGTAAGCAGAKYKLCEDFESGTVGGYPTGWTKFKGYGTGAATDVGLSTEQSRSGKMALKSSSKDKGQDRVQKTLASLGNTASKHWGRIFYRVKVPAPKPSTGSVLHVTWVGLFGNSENRVVDIVEDSAGKHQWLYNNPDDRGSVSSPYDWGFDDAWHCAEWYIDVSTKSFRFYSDSTEVTQIGFTNKGDSQMSNYTHVIAGATFYQIPPDAFTIWFDDLAIDDNRIGCN